MRCLEFGAETRHGISERARRHDVALGRHLLDEIEVARSVRVTFLEHVGRILVL